MCTEHNLKIAVDGKTNFGYNLNNILFNSMCDETPM